MIAIKLKKISWQVKTTSPKKYCVRPNTGIIKPKMTYDFTGMIDCILLVFAADIFLADVLN